MPAIGTCWAPGTWVDTAWAADTWQGAQPGTTVAAVASPRRLLIVDVPESQPLIITAGEIGDVSFQCVGANGETQDLTGAACTLRVVNINGTVVVNAVALTVESPETDGIVTWTKLLAEVSTPGDYTYQVKAVLLGGQPVYFPNALPAPGNPLTIIRPV